MTGVIDSHTTIPEVTHDAKEVSRSLLLYEVERKRHNPGGPRKRNEIAVVAG